MLWFWLVVILAAGPAYAFWRCATPAGRLRAAARRLHRDERPYAPDDDEDFLRELDRRRLHGDD